MLQTCRTTHLLQNGEMRANVGRPYMRDSFRTTNFFGKRSTSERRKQGREYNICTLKVSWTRFIFPWSTRKCPTRAIIYFSAWRIVRYGNLPRLSPNCSAKTRTGCCVGKCKPPNVDRLDGSALSYNFKFALLLYCDFLLSTCVVASINLSIPSTAYERHNRCRF